MANFNETDGFGLMPESHETGNIEEITQKPNPISMRRRGIDQDCPKL